MDRTRSRVYGYYMGGSCQTKSTERQADFSGVLKEGAVVNALLQCTGYFSFDTAANIVLYKKLKLTKHDSGLTQPLHLKTILKETI